MTHAVVKIRSQWFVYEDGDSHVIAQPFRTRAAAEHDAARRDEGAARAAAREIEYRAARLSAALAYLETRAARKPVHQLAFAF